jgi:prepilin-type N-terminal cleavage/methylation domain-containing protein
MRKAKGFSLIELLIVVAIILVIAALAIPSLLRGRIAANEASAVASIRTLTTGEHAYAQTYPQIGYTCALTELGPPAGGGPFTSAAAGVVDAVVASGAKQGYTLSLSSCAGTPRYSYGSAAVPVVPGTTGVRSFCSDSSGIIWSGSDGTEATCRAAGTVLQ